MDACCCKMFVTKRTPVSMVVYTTPNLDACSIITHDEMRIYLAYLSLLYYNQGKILVLYGAYNKRLCLIKSVDIKK